LFRSHVSIRLFEPEGTGVTTADRGGDAAGARDRRAAVRAAVPAYGAARKIRDSCGRRSARIGGRRVHAGRGARLLEGAAVVVRIGSGSTSNPSGRRIRGPA